MTIYQQGHIEEGITASQNAVSLNPDILRVLEETREGAMEELANIGEYGDRPTDKEIAINRRKFETILCLAHRGNSKIPGDISDKLARSKSLQTVDENGRNILMLAAKSGDIPLLKAILDYPEDIINETDLEGKSALIHAIESSVGTHEKTIKVIVDTLIEKGAIIEIRDNDKHWTALMYASFTGNLDALISLRGAGADSEKRDIYGMTSKDIVEFHHGNGRGLNILKGQP